ncbi:MAG TPA: Sbal_3080 family lipoprotein [Candidatus Binatia bacterium]
MKLLRLLSIGLLLSGCSITQKVDPVPRLSVAEICIIDNPDVREGFIETYRRVLESKKFQVRMLPQTATPRDCRQASTYTANWRWDLLLYLAFVDINVFVDGKSVGRAIYDSLGGSGNMSKFINAENKITELVDQLFPSAVPSSSTDTPIPEEVPK